MGITVTPYLDSKYRVRSVQYLTLSNINCAKIENIFTFLRVPLWRFSLYIKLAYIRFKHFHKIKRTTNLLRKYSFLAHYNSNSRKLKSSWIRCSVILGNNYYIYERHSAMSWNTWILISATTTTSYVAQNNFTVLYFETRESSLAPLRQHKMSHRITSPFK